MRTSCSSTQCCYRGCSVPNAACSRGCSMRGWRTEMDLRFSDADREFRARAREWLKANVPQQARPANGAAGAQFDRDWQRKLHDHGWAGVAWPREYGGLGLTGLMQVIWYEELARANAPHHINTTY